MGWKYAIKMEGIFGMVNVGCWNFGHKEGWPHPSPFLIHIQVPPFSSLIYICPNSLFKFCPEFICQEKLKICCCKACQHLFRLRLHACPQDLCLREGVKNHLPPRQHCRLSICLYFDWVWQILSGGVVALVSVSVSEGKVQITTLILSDEEPCLLPPSKKQYLWYNL